MLERLIEGLVDGIVTAEMDFHYGVEKARRELFADKIAHAAEINRLCTEYEQVLDGINDRCIALGLPADEIEYIFCRAEGKA